MEKIQFSLFDGLSCVKPLNITFQQMLELVTHNVTVQQTTQLHRQYLSENKKTQADRIKKSAVCMSVSVTFEGGKADKHIRAWTSVGMVDIDHVPQEQMAEVLQKIRQDPYTLVCFNTISSHGIRIFYRYNGLTDDFKVNKQVHEFLFARMNRHYEQLTGCPTDLKCKNATRLTVLAHDPDLYFNPQATVCSYAKMRSEADGEQKDRIRQQRQQKQLKNIVGNCQDILRSRGVVYAAGHHNEYVSQMGFLLNEFGVDEEVAKTWAKQQFSDYPQTESVLASCYRKVEDHGTRMPAGGKRNGISIAQLKEYLCQKALFRKNTISNLTELSYNLKEPEWIEMTDREVSTFWSNINQEIGNCRVNDIRLMLESEFVPLYNPFHDYIQRCGTWDGQTDYLEQLASMVHTKTPQEEEFFHFHFKKWFVGMVASLLHEEVVNNQILLLVGPQGIYKTSWLNKLLPPELSRYFCLKCDSRNLNKDDRLSLAEFAIICLEELDNIEGTLMSQIKSMTTLPRVTERAPYARYKEVRPHIASLSGTSNYHLILNDLEGNRRWLPIDVVMIDNPYEAEFNYAGIYAQAAFLAQNKKNYILTQHDIAKVNEHNQDFEVPCLERDLIQTHFRVPIGREPAQFLTNAEILQILTSGHRIMLTMIKVSLQMKKLGFQPQKVGGKRGYRVVVLDNERIELNRRSLAKDSEPPMEDEA